MRLKSEHKKNLKFCYVSFASVPWKIIHNSFEKQIYLFCLIFHIQKICFKFTSNIDNWTTNKNRTHKMDAAELRRQKILRNGNRRMELLLGKTWSPQNISTQQEERLDFILIIGMKQDPAGAEQPIIKQPLLVSSSQTSSQIANDTPASFFADTTTFPEQLTNTVPVQRRVQKVSILFTKPVAPNNSDLAHGQIRINGNETNAKGQCRFNGYSDNEIVIMFLLAFFTSMLFFFDQSYYIGQVSFLKLLLFIRQCKINF